MIYYYHLFHSLSQVPFCPGPPGRPGAPININSKVLYYSFILPGIPLEPGKPYAKRKEKKIAIFKYINLFTRSPGAPGNPKIEDEYFCCLDFLSYHCHPVIHVRQVVQENLVSLEDLVDQ
jgi:hypothetical protein